MEQKLWYVEMYNGNALTANKNRRTIYKVNHSFCMFLTKLIDFYRNISSSYTLTLWNLWYMNMNNINWSAMIIQKDEYNRIILIISDTYSIRIYTYFIIMEPLSTHIQSLKYSSSWYLTARMTLLIATLHDSTYIRSTK